MKMKVCLITPHFFEPYRVVASAHNIAINLAKKDIEVVVLTSSTKDSKKFEQYDNLKIYRIYNIYIPDPFNYTITPTILVSAYKLIKKEKPDIFIVSKYIFFTSFIIPFLKFFKKPVIITTDTFLGVIWFNRSQILNILTKIYTYTFGKFLLELSSEVILLHKYLIPTAKKLGLKRFKVIPNGVNVNKFSNARPPEDIIKQKDEIIITYVGRFDKVKGFDILLEASEGILKIYKNVTFLFVGGVKTKTEKLHKATNNRVIFKGFRGDIPNIMAISDIVVLPSFAEGLPATVMEAMAAKVPVIASSVGGVLCLIEDYKTGLLVQPGDVKALEGKLGELIENKELREKLGRNAHEFIEKNYNLDKIVDEWKRELWSVLKCN